MNNQTDRSEPQTPQTKTPVDQSLNVPGRPTGPDMITSNTPYAPNVVTDPFQYRGKTGTK
jgi:hypothetical protein